MIIAIELLERADAAFEKWPARRIRTRMRASGLAAYMPLVVAKPHIPYFTPNAQKVPADDATATASTRRSARFTFHRKRHDKCRAHAPRECGGMTIF